MPKTTIGIWSTYTCCTCCRAADAVVVGRRLARRADGLGHVGVVEVGEVVESADSEQVAHADLRAFRSKTPG